MQTVISDCGLSGCCMMYLFICGLFNDASSSPDYNCQMIGQFINVLERIWKEVVMT
jgi:hypothetical protein